MEELEKKCLQTASGKHIFDDAIEVCNKEEKIINNGNTRQEIENYWEYPKCVCGFIDDRKKLNIKKETSYFWIGEYKKTGMQDFFGGVYSVDPFTGKLSKEGSWF